MLARELLMQLPQEDADVTVVLKSLPSAVEFYKALGAIRFRCEMLFFMGTTLY